MPVAHDGKFFRGVNSNLAAAVGCFHGHLGFQCAHCAEGIHGSERTRTGCRAWPGSCCACDQRLLWNRATLQYLSL